MRYAKFLASWKTFFIALLPLQVVAYALLAGQPEIVERLYSTGFYQGITAALQNLTGFFNFPLGQVILYVGTALLVWVSVRAIRRVWLDGRSFRRVLLHVVVHGLVGLSLFYLVFMGVWGLNYYRVPFSDLVGYDVEAPYEKAELEELCRDLIAEANAERGRVREDGQGVMQLPAPPLQTLDLALIGYAEAAKTIPELAGVRKPAKKVFVPQLMSYLGIGGIFFPFTGEANVNMHQPAPLLPATICHEMAHRAGFAREDEANYIGYLTCRLHPDPAFRYSGTLLALQVSMGTLRRLDSLSFRDLRQHYHPGVVRDLTATYAYWTHYQGPIEEISSQINNLFLQANRQEDGIQSYNRMLDLLIGERRRPMNASMDE